MEPHDGSPPRNVSAKSVLVIDDEELNLKLLTRVLTRAGYRVISARSAEEGLRQILGDRPDLVLMDMRMAGMDGLEATRRIKADPRTASLPVVAVSAYSMEEDLSRARDAGCVAYVTKPFRMQEILEVVRTHMPE